MRQVSSRTVPRGQARAERGHSRLRLLTLAIVLGALLAGCAGRGYEPDSPGAYDRLVRDLAAERSDEWSALPPAFLAREDFVERMHRLERLHQDAQAQSEADREAVDQMTQNMLEAYYGDLRAHRLRHRLALAGGDTDSGEFHERAVDALLAAIEDSGEGTADSPWQVVSATEAYVWLASQRKEVAGALYHGDDEKGTLALVLKARPRDEDNLSELWFDLTPTLRATQRQMDTEGPAPTELIAARARDGDSAAQTAHAIRLWHEGNQDSAVQAVHWLRSASEQGNVIAREMLGVVYGVIARTRRGEEAEQLVDAAVDQFLLAVGQGSSTALYNLGQLYLSGHYGEENQPTGVEMLRQAVARDNLDAMVLLARLRYNGQFVSQDLDAALELLERAAERRHAEAQLFYARHLLSTDEGAGFDDRALAWLEDAATEGESVQAMLLLGTLYAQGEHAPHDTEQAVTWLKQAAESTLDADTINTVAWVLVVAEQLELRDPAYGLELMNTLMARDQLAAVNAAYLDTWAAAHAANGDFERAVEIQERAVSVAEAEHAERDDDGPEYLPLLREHMELFRSGQTVSEDVP